MAKGMLRLTINLAFLLFLCESSSAQKDQRVYDLKNVAPPSPNASSLGKYTDWPVNLYTGLPQISIPIYELKGRSTSVGISLSYHASGIKVGEYASSVGSGWSLQAGGCITRSVRGLPDEEDGVGYWTIRSHYNNPGDLSSGTTPASRDSVDQLYIVDANGDSEPDLYMINAMGKSYKFYFAGDGTIVTQPYSNLKITSNIADSSWTVLTEDGTKLKFGGGYKFVEKTSNQNFLPYIYISSWYLKTITSPSGEVINFTYTVSFLNQESYYYQTDYVLDHVATNITSGSAVTTKTAQKIFSSQDMYILNLATIESDLGRIDIDTSSRLDLPGASAITGIKIYSKLRNSYIKSFKLNYTYSNAVNSNTYNSGPSAPAYRLKLASLEEIPSDNTPHKFWQFSYNPANLPSRKSFAQDYWGYFNGATSNTTMLPFCTPFNPDQYSFGNRAADSTSMMAEMLTKIVYPTGGDSRFNFEPNSYPANEEQFGNVTNYPHLYLTYNQTNFRNTQIDTFTIRKAQYFKFQFRGLFSSSYSNNFGSTTVLATASLKNSAGTPLSSISLKKANSGITYTNPSILLDAGTYTFTTSSISGPGDFFSPADNVDLSTNYSYQPSLGYKMVNHPVGGVRVQSIFYYDNVDSTKSIKKYYQYENANVVSPLDTTVDFVSLTTDNTYDCAGTLTPCGFVGCLATSVVFKARNASTLFSLGNIQGGTVSYGKVTEKFGANAENGKNVYYYTYMNDLNVSSAKAFPYPQLVSLDYERGLLQEEDNYTAGNLLINRTLNNYGFIRRGSVNTYKVAFRFNVVSSCYSYSYLRDLVSRVFYQDYTFQGQRGSSAQIVYNTATGDSLITTNYYNYDDSLNMQPTRGLTITSKGDSVLTYSRTALEKTDINNSIALTAAASLAIDSMKVRNMVGVPIESEKYTKNILVTKAITNFRVQGSGLVLPDNVMVQNANNALETRLLFQGYNNMGNLVEQLKTSDEKRDYIWDYQYTYPVAEVISADSNSIAFTSFEADGTGNWTISSSLRDNTSAITGKQSYNLSNGAISKNGLVVGQSYFITYWSTNGTKILNVTGSQTTPTLIRTVNGWTMYKQGFTLSSTSIVSVTGSGLIDELRLYPQGAQMTTYTHEPLVGTTSMSDLNGETTYYEYDGFGRLKNIKDYQGNIIKNYQYNYGISCGSNCFVLPAQNLSGSNIISYPVGVFNINGQLLGNAASPAQLMSLWNANSANQAIGVLSAGPDSTRFNLNVNAGQSPPSAIKALRFYQFDIPYIKIDGIRNVNGAYIDFGDSTRMWLGKSNYDTTVPLAPNTTMNFFPLSDPWDDHNLPYFIHTYPNNNVKTITLYHNDSYNYETPSIDNMLNPATSLTKVKNLRGNIPQYGTKFAGSCYQEPTMLSVAAITNWGSINSITSWSLNQGDGINPCKNLNYAQDFMQNNRGLNQIFTSYNYYTACYIDTTFKISRLKSNWTTYFSELQDIQISDDHWNREDLSALLKLRRFVVFATTQDHTNNSSSPLVPIPTSVIDNIINQISAGAGPNISNGQINVASGGTNRTTGSDAAVNQLKAKGWTIYVNGTIQ